MDRLSIRIGAEPPARLDKALARDVPEQASLSRTRLAKLIDEGAVTQGGIAVTDPKTKVAEGDIFDITLPQVVEVETKPQDIPLDIQYEDDDLVVVLKPAGMVVHPAPGTPDGTLVNALMYHCGDSLSGIGGEKRPGIVHRIDKDTSGLLVVAKNDAAHHALAAQFESHSAERAYLAVCYGSPDASDPRLRGVKGTSFEQGGVLKITTRLGRHRTDRQKQAVSFENGRHAVTRARVIEPLGGGVAALIECRLETGRTHQIRVHMAHVGHGLIGDPVYGGNRKLAVKAVGEAGAQAASGFARQALHAAELGIEHPKSGEMLRFTAPMPQDMADLITALKSGN
jgi:23S rRNA pseudouridine1911/1915/1917 synthase